MMILYMIPGRTGGAQIKARDLRMVMDEYPGRIIGVKDATGNLENMKEVRSRCGSEIAILSGDDGMTPNTIRHQEILGSGAVSVMSNLAPAAMSKLVWALLDNDAAEAARLEEMLSPLFQVVSIKTDDGEVWPNPCSIKIMMNILGMPSGPLRPPLGRVNPKCFFQILDALKTVQYEQEVIEPIESFFGVNAKQRIDEAPGKSNNIHYPC
jgi:4-hydroxy-tetrahydrodipicolinate synthase